MGIDIEIVRQQVEAFKRLVRSLAIALLKAGGKAQVQAKQNAPKDTGMLRRTIAVRLVRDGGQDKILKMAFGGCNAKP